MEKGLHISKVYWEPAVTPAVIPSILAPTEQSPCFWVTFVKTWIISLKESPPILWQTIWEFHFSNLVKMVLVLQCFPLNLPTVVKKYLQVRSCCPRTSWEPQKCILKALEFFKIISQPFCNCSQILSLSAFPSPNTTGWAACLRCRS